MGRKMDLLLGRSSRQSAKLKALLGLTVSRLSVLRNQRHVRCAQARGDVAQLLQLGHQDRALLRVEQVIKEQNMLDVFVIIEGYCLLLTERAALLEHQGECPEELREAAASLIFAATRCGDLPELQDVRRIFSSKFGKEFSASAAELRNNCRVNTKMIQKLSTRQASLESRVTVAKQIAAERGIAIDLDEPSSEIQEVDQGISNQSKEQQSQPTPSSTEEQMKEEPKLEKVKHFSQSMKSRQEYKDVASAARAALESAEYAAAAARAAVELSRSESRGKGSDDQSRSVSERRQGFQEWNRDEGQQSSAISDVEKINPVPDHNSESENLAVPNSRKPIMPQLEMSSSSLSSESIEVQFAKPIRPEIKFDESESDTEKQSHSGRGIGLGYQAHTKSTVGLDKNFSDRDEARKLHPPPYQKRNTLRGTKTSQSFLQQEGARLVELGSGNEDNPVADHYEGRRIHAGSVYRNTEDKMRTQVSSVQRPVSVRTRKGF